MDSSWMQRHTTMNMDTGNGHYIPAWKMPISKSFSGALSGDKAFSESSSGIGSGGERDTSTSSSDPESCPVEALKRQGALSSRVEEEEEEGQVIQILIPCMVCNRTFAPEALERHSNVCTKVNVKTPYKQDRKIFESAEQRKKGTRAEFFVPPPDLDTPDSRLSSFSRGSKNRSSLRGTSCTTRSTLNSESHGIHHGFVHPPTTPTAPSPLRRQRSVSQTRGERGHSKPPSEYLYDDHSEFGSNSEESQTIPDHEAHLPSYARPIIPKDECPFCHRQFSLKAFDRHVQYCQEKYVKSQYEIQPVPKDRIEAMERQEIRTKYRPMKGSTSCTSLRSVSPGKDFASMAYKIFGLRRSDGTSNLYNNQLPNFKKSNESLTNSCYGDYTRGMRRPSPSPSIRGMSMANKINNLLSKTFQSGSSNNSSNALHPMRVNTTSNIPKLAKSSDNLSMSMMMGGGNSYAHIPSSGYGPQASFANNNFNRNSRSRSSLHKNFFRSKRSEPEGTENTGTVTNSGSGNGGNGMSSSPLIITPMSFYSKTNKGNQPPQEIYRPKGNTFLSQDPSYDPYEMAAKQLEELLKTQPIPKNVNRKTARKLGLGKAFESVGVPSDIPEPPRRSNLKEDIGGNKSNEDSFVFDLGTSKMDDSYWDEILKKSEKEKRENQMMSMPTPETKSQQSDTDINKTRALSQSQISSADSGYSRSENNDAEFEALESMMGGQRVQQNPLASVHPSVTRLSFMRRSQSSSKEPESPMQTSPPPLTPGNRRDSDSSTGQGTGARFCHECGNSYPSTIAKFCSDCGEKRVFRF